MTAIILNNENKSKVIFQYDHGLPYKKSIRPKAEYGDWESNNSITLVKIYLTKAELNLFSNKVINCQEINLIKNDFWLDLEDVYLVLKSTDYLTQRITSKQFIIIFFNENKEQINAWKFS